MTNKLGSKRGRPELSDSERRSVVTQFRCTPEERERMERAAKSRGKRLSDWLRELAIRGAKRAT